MTVKELRERLEKEPNQDLQVFISSEFSEYASEIAGFAYGWAGTDKFITLEIGRDSVEVEASEFPILEG